MILVNDTHTLPEKLATSTKCEVIVTPRMSMVSLLLRDWAEVEC